MTKFTFFLFSLIFSLSSMGQELRALLGNYTGVLSVQGAELRLFLEVKANEHDSIVARFASPDQGVDRIEIDEINIKDGKFLLKSKSIKAFFKGSFNSDKSKLEGEWNQAFMSIPLSFDRVENLPAILRPQTPVPPYPYDNQEVTFQNSVSGFKLAGTLSLPREGKNFPAIILISGSGPQDRDESLLGHKPFAVLADFLCRNGYAVLRYDDRGVGKSTGQFASATTTDFSTDAEAAFRFLKNYKKINPQQIGLLGHSEGGIVAGMIAARNSELAFLILLAGPGETGEKIILDQTELISRASGMDENQLMKDLETTRKIYSIAKKEKNRDKAFRKIKKIYLKNQDDTKNEALANNNAAIDQTVNQVLSGWFLEFLKLDPADFFSKVSIPVLALNGEKDLQVPASSNLAALEQALLKAGNTRFECKVLPGLNHLFQTSTTGLPTEYSRIEETMSPTALQSILDWLSKNVPADSAQ
jgi:pimeloyl-ACP methyl ester carboxylesterase